MARPQVHATPANAHAAGRPAWCVPDPGDALLEAARAFVRRQAPTLRETMRHGVPFFVARRPALYLNPSRDGLWIGFPEGAAMVEFHGVFDEVLKVVAKVHVRTPRDLRRPGLDEAVRAAAEMAA